MCREKILTNTIHTVPSYARAFQEYYAMCFVNPPVLNLVDYVKLSNFLATNFTANYAVYVPLAKTTINNKSVLQLLVSLDMNTLLIKALGITHLDERGLRISTKQGILLINPAADAFMKKIASPLHSRPVIGERPRMAIEGQCLLSS